MTNFSVIIYGIIIVVVFVAIISNGNMIADEIINIILRKRFKKNLINSLNNDHNPTWPQVKIMAEANSVLNVDILRVLRFIVADILSGESDLEAKHIPILEQYIEYYRRDEPFEQMPSDIKIHFERLKENENIKTETLQPLSAKICELLEIKSKENKTQKIINFLSMIVGVVGLIVAIYQTIKI